MVFALALAGASCSNPVEENLRKGNVFFAHRELDEAEAAYRRALEADARSTLALEGLGNVRFERGDLDGAIAHYAAAAADPRAINARHRLAVARTERGDLEGAVRALEGALEIDPADVYALYALGGLEERRGRRAKAEARQREALRIEPGHRGARFALAGILVDSHRFEEAEVELGRLEAGGAAALAEYGFARMAARQGRADLAAKRLERVLELGVTHPGRVLADDAFTARWSDPAMAAVRGRVEAASARELSAAPARALDAAPKPRAGTSTRTHTRLD